MCDYYYCRKLGRECVSRARGCVSVEAVCPTTEAGSVRDGWEIAICRIPAVQVRLRTSSPPRPQTTCMGSDQQFHRSICEGLDNNLRLSEEIGHVSTKHCALNNNSRRKLCRARRKLTPTLTTGKEWVYWEGLLANCRMRERLMGLWTGYVHMLPFTRHLDSAGYPLLSTTPCNHSVTTHKWFPSNLSATLPSNLWCCSLSIICMRNVGEVIYMNKRIWRGKNYHRIILFVPCTIVVYFSWMNLMLSCDLAFASHPFCLYDCAASCDSGLIVLDCSGLFSSVLFSLQSIQFTTHFTQVSG